MSSNRRTPGDVYKPFESQIPIILLKIGLIEVLNWIEKIKLNIFQSRIRTIGW